ncbi:MAG: hypothetical protein C4333_14580, partial [Meiothermus sp.]
MPTPTLQEAGKNKASADPVNLEATRLADALPHPAWIVTGDAGAVFFNRSFLRFTGLTPSPDPQAVLAQALHPDDRPGWEAAWSRAQQGEQDLELRLRRHDGQYCWFSVHLAPLDGAGWAVTCTEVDALRRAQDDLIAAREQMGEAFFALDRDWRFTYLNREAERLLRRSREELLGKGIWEEYADAVGSEFHRQYTRAMQEGIPAAFEAYYPPLETWFEVHLHPQSAGLGVHFRDVNERKQAEAALRHSELKHHRLFETVPLGVVYQDREGRIISANPAAQRILGLSLEQLQGMTSLDPRWHTVRDDGSDFPGEEHPAMVALRTGRPVRDTLMGVFHPKLGEYRWISVDATPLFEEGVERPTQVYTVFRDVTERRRAETALRESEERFRALSEHAPIGIYFSDPTGYNLYTNPQAQRIGGYTLEQGLGRGWVEFVHPDDRERVIAECGAATRAGQAYEIRYRWLRPDGTVRSSRVLGVPLTGADGQVVGYVGTVEDTTERERAEEALRDSEERYRSLVEATAQIVWTCDASGQFAAEQPGWAAFTGQSFEEYRGWGWLEAVHPDDRERVSRTWRECVREQRVYEIEYLLRRHDGEYRHMQVRSVPVRAPGGGVREWVGIHTDVTEEKRAERASAYLAAIVESSVDAVISKDLSGVITSWNKGAEAMYGYTAEEVVGKPVMLITPPHLAAE